MHSQPTKEQAGIDHKQKGVSYKEMRFVRYGNQEDRAARNYRGEFSSFASIQDKDPGYRDTSDTI